MTEHNNNDDFSRPEALGGPRMKFQGIVESAGGDDEKALSASRDEPIPAIPVGPPVRNWNAASRQVWQVSRLGAILIFFAMTVGWPVGAYWSHMDLYGSSSGWVDTLRSTMNPQLLFFAIFVPIMILICGYLLSHVYKMLNAAQSITTAAQEFIHPDHSAAYNAEAVGLAVRGQMDALNSGVDGALRRLASVEAMIRNHVEAIETAGTAIETRTSGAVDKVASERSRLIELTENLNTQADAFAAAIAERAQVSIEAMGSADDLSTRAETLLEERLSRLEMAASKALQSFETLSSAINGADESLRNSAGAIEASSEKARQASEQAAKLTQNASDEIARNADAMSGKIIETTESETAKAQAAADKALQSLNATAQSALAAASEKADTVSKATTDALSKIQASSSDAVKGAEAEATRASKAAGAVTQTAKETSQSVSDAAAELSRMSETMEKTAEDALARSQNAASKISERNKILADARAALEKENARLENLIEEQRNRADRLADAIATQTERLSKLAEGQLREQEAAIQRQTAAAVEPPRRVQSAPKAKTQDSDKKVLKLGRRAQRAEAPPANHAQNRLDQLAEDIAASRPEKPTSARKAQKGKGDVSWREILDATDDAEPLDLAAASKSAPEAPQTAAAQDNTANAMKIIADLQHFTLNLETRLYGDPPPALRERFEKGDRNVFANRILRLNEADVKRRIRTESGRDRAFEEGIHSFLQGFERLLEDATTSETADEDLEEYLSSPLGRVYLLIGATVGYFA